VLFHGFPTYALSVVLCALLLWTGVGSLLAGWVPDRRRALTVALAAACVVIAASASGLHPQLAALIDLPFAARVTVTVALLAPARIALGMAMPLGLRRLATLHPAAWPGPGTSTASPRWWLPPAPSWPAFPPPPSSRSSATSVPSDTSC
jgi:hypothetical protein